MTAYLGRFKRKFFVRALGVYLKGLGFQKILSDGIVKRLFNGIYILGKLVCKAEIYNSEDLRNGAFNGVEIGVVVLE